MWQYIDSMGMPLPARHPEFPPIQWAETVQFSGVFKDAMHDEFSRICDAEVEPSEEWDDFVAVWSGLLSPTAP